MKFFKFMLFFSVLSVFSQNRKIDSLELVLKNHINKDTAYVNLLNKIVEALPQKNNNRVVEIFTEAIKVSDSLNYLKGKAEAYYIFGIIKEEQLDLDSGKDNFNKASTIYTQLGDDLGVARSLSHIGLIYTSRENYEKALSYFYKSLEANRIVDDNLIKAHAYNNIGNIYNLKNELDKREADYKKALEYYNKSLAIYRKLNKINYVVILLNNIGTIYSNKKLYNKSLQVYEECLRISKLNNKENVTAYVTNNIAILYQEKKDFKKAKIYFYKALYLFEKKNDNLGICFVNSNIGDLFKELKMFNKALFYIDKSNNIAYKYNIVRYKMINNEMLSLIYSEKRNYHKALYYFKKYKVGFDSISLFSSKNKLSELEKKYKFKTEELLVKEKELELNNGIEVVNKKLDKTRKQILVGLLLMLLLIVVLVFVVYNSRIRSLSLEYQKVVLKQKLLRSQMKPHFIFNSLSVLQGIVLQKEYNKASTYIYKFSLLLREILETSKKEIINLKTEIKIIENYIFLQQISHNSNCSYKINIDKNIDINRFYIPPMIVQPIVENSFEHGFIEVNRKYSLSIDFKFKDKDLICTIIDNGEGLNEIVKKSFEKKKSFSSTIIKERLELFSNKVNKKYSFDVIDRKNEGARGTKVIILLPYEIEKN